MQSKDRSKYLLTEGGILKKLLLVALPIIGSQIIQMTYNLTDMFWLGRLSSGAVAASGTVGMYLWLSMAFATFGAKGAEIGVSQNTGRGDLDTARDMGQTSLSLSLVMGLGYMALLLLFGGPLVRFLKIEDPEVYAAARTYLTIVALGVPFNFVSGAVIGIFTGSGNSRTPFWVNILSLGTNMVLDPLLIFTLGMGVQGAAVATVAAQILACALLLRALYAKNSRPFEKFRLFAKMQRDHLRQIFAWATPIAVEGFFFTLLSMFVTRLINGFGLDATAASRVGSQVESLSWLIAGGYASALTAFVGQNYGGRKWGRIHRGFELSTIAMSVWGLFVTLLLFFGGRTIYTLFLPGDPGAVQIGVEYLQILALCQFFQCMEGIAAGSFRGMGMTLYPSIVSFTSNAGRVLLAYALSRTGLGLNGVFWAISLGAIVRGVWMYLWYLLKYRSLPQQDEEAPSVPVPAK